jgi:hypothetical protein
MKYHIQVEAYYLDTVRGVMVPSEPGDPQERFLIIPIGTHPDGTEEQIDDPQWPDSHDEAIAEADRMAVAWNATFIHYLNC